MKDMPYLPLISKPNIIHYSASRGRPRLNLLFSINAHMHLYRKQNLILRHLSSLIHYSNTKLTLDSTRPVWAFGIAMERYSQSSGNRNHDVRGRKMFCLQNQTRANELVLFHQSTPYPKQSNSETKRDQL